MRARLELRSIRKTFSQVIANDDISLSVRKGEIRGLLGENGAGKTTLMDIVYGIHQPDSGEIIVDGAKRRIASPKAAMDLGIGMVHQHFALVPQLTVVENVVLGMARAASVLKLEPAAERIREIADSYGVGVDPWEKVENLSVGQLQRVEIMKALYRDVQILILDEPTSLLTPSETEGLFRLMGELSAEGRSIVFITHKLKEVLAVANRVTVLRQGRVEATLDISDADEHGLARLMVGEKAVKRSRRPSRPKSVRKSPIKAERLDVLDDRGHLALKNLELEVFGGEILGVAGVEGNGQRELTEVLAGLRKPAKGTVQICETDIKNRDHSEVIDLGMGFIPEDRQGAGLIMGFSVEENLVLRRQDRQRLMRKGFLERRKVQRFAEALISQFEIATPSSKTPLRQLSGGNQQKVILARELHRPTQVVLASQPTRGLDVAAAAYVREIIRRHRDAGAAVLFISTDLDEILQISDRIAVLFEGRFVAVLPASEADRVTVGLMMAGQAVPEVGEEGAKERVP